MSEEPRRGPLILLDGMSLVFRAYFALPPNLATTSGTVTNAVHGFSAMLVNLVRDHHPSALAVAFDLPEPTFRDHIVEGYKAGRAETPDDLLPQFDMVRGLLRSLALPVIEVPGFEADDVLATLATQARDRGTDVVVVTGDRDCFQLVEDPHVRVLYNRRGVSDYSLYDEGGIVERTGVEPARYPMLAALRGDPSDNLPGVPGVGEKTAAKLLNSFGDLDGIFSHLAELSPKLRQNLAEHEATARANVEVIHLVRDVPLEVSLSDLDLGGWDLETAHQAFESLELSTVWRRVVGLLEEGRFGPPAPTSNVPSGWAAGVEVGATAPAAGAVASGDDDGAGPGTGPTLTATAPAVVLPTSVEVDCPADEAAAVAALAALTPAGSDALVGVAGRWVGDSGRSALRGVALACPEPPDDPAASAMSGQSVWIGADLLAAPTVCRALDGLLGRARLTGHHVKELLRSLLPLGVDARGLVMDTAVAAYLLDSSTGDYSLDAVVRAVTGDGGDGTVPAARSDGPVSSGAEVQLSLGDAAPDGGLPPGGTPPSADGAEPAALEAAATTLLHDPLRAALEAEGLTALHDDIECPLVRVLARMEVVGIRVDSGELRHIADELVGDTRALEEEIQRLAGHAFNVNSTPQLRTVLFEELELVPTRKTKTGYSTDAATLEALRDEHPIVDALLRYREVEKLRSTYGESLIAEVAEDGRIHASFRQTVARTGRLSSDRPNLHNIPVRTDLGRRFRRAFVPSEGCSFLVADYDQIELRVIAHLSGDPGLTEAFRSGADIHRAVAAGVYGVPAEEVTRPQRERAKMVSYGLAYGMEAYGLARRLATGVEEASDIMDRYFRAFPEVRAYMDATVAEARSRGYTRTALGRKRPIPGLNDRNYRARQAAERQAMNAGIQGLAADLFKAALVRLDHALAEGGHRSRLVLQVHDEVLVDVVAGEEPAVEGLVGRALRGAADLSVPLEVSMAWGASWAEAKGG